jgi:hypothetical protein
MDGSLGAAPVVHHQSLPVPPTGDLNDLVSAEFSAATLAKIIDGGNK